MCVALLSMGSTFRLVPIFLFHRAKCSFLAAFHKTFGGGLQFLPAGANLSGFGGCDLTVGGGVGDDGEEVGEFLHNLVGGGNEKSGVRRVLRIQDEETAGALADPLHEPVVAGALDERLDAVEGIVNAAAGGVGFAPFVDHGGGEFEVGGDFLVLLFFKDFAEEFVGLHGLKMLKRGIVGKREAITN